ncbi:MAG: hypothetical protein O3C28_04165 [Proteobacteria bacterium]|nr:hypothetical protein [Pseudomonadota bacterium]
MEQMIRAGVDFRESDDLFADSASVDADRGSDRNQGDSGITRISSTSELEHTSESDLLATNSENVTLKAGESQSKPVNQAFTRDELVALKLAQKHGIRVDLDTNSTAPAQKGPISIRNEHAREAPVPDGGLRKRFEKAQVSLQQDQEQGLAALKELAAEGHADSALFLAELASRDESSTKSPGDVTAWLVRAAVLGNTEAQYRLGEQYMHGTRVVEDEAMAISFYRDAALGGHKLAKEKLRAIYARAGLPAPDLSRPPNGIVPTKRISANPLSVESHDDEDAVGDPLHSPVEGDLSSGEARAPANVAERVANTEIDFSELSSGMERSNTLSESVRVTLETAVTQEMSPPAEAAEATVVNLARDSSPINSMNEVGIRLGDLPSVETSESTLFGDRYPTDLMVLADRNMDEAIKLNTLTAAQRHLDARAELTSQINSGAP